MSMLKVLHTADLHLGARFRGLQPEKAVQKRKKLELLLDSLVDYGRECDLVLLAGDLFDQPQAEGEIVRLLGRALERLEVPVFIAPGNHDYICSGSPYTHQLWPENVHIFKRDTLESVVLPQFDCRIWGAGYQSMDCPGLLEGFHVRGEEAIQLMVLHGDPLGLDSPYCPVTRRQVEGSGLSYLALGHIHKAGQMQLGNTLALWPGCPMGHGFDETGPKGFWITEITEEKAVPVFYPLHLGSYEELNVEVGENPIQSVLEALPADAKDNVYRIRLRGQCENPNLSALSKELENRVFHFELLDETELPWDLWKTAGEDSLEGIFFRMLQESAQEAGEGEREIFTLAAKLSRRILEGQEVELP